MGNALRSLGPFQAKMTQYSIQLTTVVTVSLTLGLPAQATIEVNFPSLRAVTYAMQKMQAIWFIKSVSNQIWPPKSSEGGRQLRRRGRGRPTVPAN